MGRPRNSPRKRDVLAGHCADIGRDPKEIMLSSHVRLDAERDYQQVVADAAALGAEGLDLAIVICRRPTIPRYWSHWPKPSVIQDWSQVVTAGQSLARGAVRERGSTTLATLRC